MFPFRPKLVLVLALLALAPLSLVSGCGGAEFEAAAGGAAGSSVGGGGQSGGGGSGSGVLCSDQQDCDDADPCTTDFCTVQGTCQAAPQCTGSQRCCDGECAQCCDDADCDDGIACTSNTCFAGRCMFSPDDAACAPTEACSVTEGCKAKIACGPALPLVTCEDSSVCTVDGCVDGFCSNRFCEQGSVCCDDGCAPECCDDAGCPAPDACSVGSCRDGRCVVEPLCPDGQSCCPNADGLTASCGSCCSATDCDDRIACTKDACTGVVLSCQHRPDSTACAPGETCSPTLGCVRQVQCDDASDCTADACGRCDQGVCKYDCPSGQPCCRETNSCAACCGDASCDDGIACTLDQCTSGGCTHTPDDATCQGGYQCLPKAGGCVQCTADAGCDDGNACTTDSCDLASFSCVHEGACECKTTYECGAVVAQAAALPRPIPVGWVYCPSCVDGQCKLVACYGECCSSGCSGGGLCAD